MPDNENSRDGGLSDLKPRPDPTALTNAAIASAEEGLRREIANVRAVLEARMDSIDNRRDLLLQIMDERTAETQRRFDERDLRFNERDRDRQAAAAAALAAARELGDTRDAAADKAIEKFEVSVREQIRQLAELSGAGRDRLDAKIQALKERLDRGEGVGSGQSEYRSERRLDNASLIQFLGLIVAVAVALFAVLHG